MSDLPKKRAARIAESAGDAIPLLALWVMIITEIVAAVSVGRPLLIIVTSLPLAVALIMCHLALYRASPKSSRG